MSNALAVIAQNTGASEENTTAASDCPDTFHDSW